MATPKLTHARIRRRAGAALARRTGIRERVRDLTLRALKRRPLEPAQVREVIRSMTEGIALGASRHPRRTRTVLSQAFAGLDDALGKAAQASQLALRELASRTKRFNDRELRKALGHTLRLERDFLSTVGQVAGKAGREIGRELRDLVTHARRAGTDTGAQTAATLSEFSRGMGSVMAGGARAGLRAAREASVRFADLAGGILAGTADALRSPDRPRKAAVRKRPRPARRR